jgi:arginyl-tRNA synthetase
MIRTRIESELKKAYPDITFEVFTPPDANMGDYSTNIAFALAKHGKRNPLDAGKDVAALFDGAEWLDRAEVVPPGFVNFFLKQEFLQKELVNIHEQGAAYGTQNVGDGKTVIVEYSSPNIAKPMHVGHLRSTVIGDALANVYEALGYDVVRWNFIGDWGTQFGKLIFAWKRWRPNIETIEEMLRLYVEFNKDMKDDPNLEISAREEFAKLENGDNENREIWEKVRATSKIEFSRMYHRLGVHAFDVKKGESEYETKLKPLIDDLVARGIAKESEGALIIDLADRGLPPGLLRKSDGATLYLTRDIASLQDRVDAYHPAKILYVVANQQALHFEQLFAVKDILKLGSTETVHVKFGMVLGEDGKKFATREGNAIELQEVLDKVTERALKKVREKNAELSDGRAQEIAHAVGVAALKYNDLRQHPHSDIVFDWDAMLDLSGNSGPYLQYTYARLASILAKARSASSGQEGEHDAGDVTLLVEPVERALMRHLLDFPYVIEQASHLYALNGIALYLYELANLSNRFYESIHILTDENTERRNARLMLIKTITATLGRGLKLLGITPLERI